MEFIKIEDIIIEHRIRSSDVSREDLISLLPHQDLMNPISVWRSPAEEGKFQLIAGFRRLTSISELSEKEIPITYNNEKVPLGYVPCNILDISTQDEAEAYECSENLVRKQFSRSEGIVALEKLNAFYKKEILGIVLSNDPERREKFANLVKSSVEDSEKKIDKISQLVVEVNGEKKISDEGLKELNNFSHKEGKTLKKLDFIKKYFGILDIDITLDWDTESVENLLVEISSKFLELTTALKDSMKNELETQTNQEVGSKHQIFSGDFREVAKKEIKDGTIDMVITDPPYGQDAHKSQHGYYDGFEYALEIFPNLLSESIRVLRDGGILVMFCSSSLSRYYRDAFQRYPTSELELYGDDFVCNKGGQGQLDNWGIKKNSESFLLFRKGSQHNFYASLTTSVHSKYWMSDELKKDEAEKPQSILSYLIEYGTIPGQVILDFMAGSGSVMEACFRLKRESISIELDDERANLIRVRKETLIPTMEGSNETVHNRQSDNSEGLSLE